MSEEQETKHTPGQWNFHDEKLYGFWGGVCASQEDDDEDADCVDVCAIIDGPDAEANAHLIGAAPDLLVACKAILEATRPSYIYSIPIEEARELLSAAISKAEGGAV